MREITIEIGECRTTLEPNLSWSMTTVIFYQRVYHCIRHGTCIKRYKLPKGTWVTRMLLVSCRVRIYRTVIYEQVHPE